MDDWEVSASDDEWNEYSPPDATNKMFIPERLARLFKKVEEEKVLTLSCHCPRVGPKKETPQTNNAPITLTPAQSEERVEEPMEVQGDNNKSFEAFDFSNEDSEKPSIKRKTPASAKRGKKEKVGSMTNVMSDLLRHKYLDDLEAAKKEEAKKEETKAK